MTTSYGGRAPRTAIVTGATRGLGQAVAQALLQDGYKLALWGRDRRAMQAAVEQFPSGASCLPVFADIREEVEVRRAFAESLEFLSDIDVLVNNAGAIGPRMPLEEVALADFKATMDVNLTGAFLVLREVLPHMKARRAGRIVNIASVAGKEGNALTAVYSASKAAMIALTKSLGKEVAGHGILVNCVTPSASRTDIFGEMTLALEAKLLSRVPLGRFVRPDEVAAMVRWLASEACSFSTGAIFDISGGRATY
jgi:2-dehydro-3-deoxy-L-rhamnonate dehydrogenase (NAD+)